MRLPLIPDITDTEENARAVLNSMRDAGLRRVALLPYNASAPAKYEWLDRQYEITGEPQSAEALDHLVELAASVGLEARPG
ncbi:MAG: radical SAM family protein [Planctomycetota bacterium]